MADNRPVPSSEVFEWPEFKALVKRLGVPTGKDIRCLFVSLEWDAAAMIEMEFFGVDTEKA